MLACTHHHPLLVEDSKYITHKHRTLQRKKIGALSGVVPDVVIEFKPSSRMRACLSDIVLNEQKCGSQSCLFRELTLLQDHF